MEPAVASEELIGEGVSLEEIDKALELGRIFGADIGSLTEEMLGITYAPYPVIDGLATEAGVDDDRTDFETGWF